MVTCWLAVMFYHPSRSVLSYITCASRVRRLSRGAVHSCGPRASQEKPAAVHIVLKQGKKKRCGCGCSWAAVACVCGGPGIYGAPA
ncbi:hypothetical protein JB92DRAFT_2846780 [Gautieria morchelliformis]|nr:hypothetical protein JB92DRAFT_2846780 [Gautieria morchelliformis]